MSKLLSFDLCENFLGSCDSPGTYDSRGNYDSEEDNHERVEKAKKLLLFVMKEQLSPRQKQMLILYFFERKNMVEIAAMLNVNKSTVSRTIHRGLEHLKNFLKYYEFR